MSEQIRDGGRPLSPSELDGAIAEFVASLTRTVIQEEAAVEVIAGAMGDNLEAIYLYGSSVDGGLQPHSDVDLFVVARRALTSDDRASLLAGLSPISSRHRRPVDWRPLEVTVVRATDLRPWRHPSRVEIQLGEWLREGLDAGNVPGPHDSPDLTVLASQLLASAKTLFGPDPAVFIEQPAASDLNAAMVDSLPAVVADLETDTANVLLTLARMWFTIETGRFAPKDVAADWAITRLGSTDSSALERARDFYLGEENDDWTHVVSEVRLIAQVLEGQIRQRADR